MKERLLFPVSNLRDESSSSVSISQRFERIFPLDSGVLNQRPVAIESPIAIEINGIGYAVLMATPAELKELATGFVLSERLADDAKEIIDIDAHQSTAGWIVRLTLSAHLASRVYDRVRHRASESSCGLCGLENLEQAMRPLPKVHNRFAGSHRAVFTAIASLRDLQPLNQLTGAAHAAALCDHEGTVRLVFEDVGRHNAFDKLIGAMARRQIDWSGGFALLSSRCSYELVEKAALANCPLLATISAPTDLAIARAAEAGLPLISLARPDAALLAR
jgi:FdhD protein